MRIKEKILVEIKHMNKKYLVPIDVKHDMTFEYVDHAAWDADVDYLPTDDTPRNSDYPYPYFTIWGEIDEQDYPTTNCMHALVNYENYEMRVGASDIRVLECK